MGDYAEYIEEMKRKWSGKKVIYKSEIYTVMDVDYNGALMINKKARFTDTTAVDASDVEEWNFFECDPAKNFECEKTNCFLNGGPCTMTTKEEFRRG